MGIASCVLFGCSCLLLDLYVALIVWSPDSDTGHPVVNIAIMLSLIELGFAAALSGLCLSLAGLGLGIAGLFQGKRKKTTAVTGIVLNGLALLMSLGVLFW
jgi:hypothetical protein